MSAGPSGLLPVRAAHHTARVRSAQEAASAGSPPGTWCCHCEPADSVLTGVASEGVQRELCARCGCSCAQVMVPGGQLVPLLTSYAVWAYAHRSVFGFSLSDSSLAFLSCRAHSPCQRTAQMTLWGA